MSPMFMASLRQGAHVTTALREFKDGEGQAWEVWDVVPTNHERRFQRPATPPTGVERRQKPEFRVNLGMQMVNGWLIFASGSLRRRLAPVPDHWHERTDDELRGLLASATPVSRGTTPLLRLNGSEGLSDEPSKD